MQAARVCGHRAGIQSPPGSSAHQDRLPAETIQTGSKYKKGLLFPRSRKVR